MQDWHLLRQYVDNGSDAAFAQIARKYANLVYATCRREVGDEDLTEDVAQAVFLLLARKAPALRRGTILAGWLFQTSILTSRNAVRDERRRLAREQKAVELMDDRNNQNNATWEAIEPHFHGAMLALKSGEREAVLLRLCEDLSLRETGDALGVSEDAARMRVTRGIEKMRRYFAKHGIAVSAIGLSALITTHAANAAVSATSTMGIAGISSQALGHASHVAASAKAITIAQGVYRTMIITNLKFAAAAIICGVFIIGGSAYKLVPVKAQQPRPSTLKISTTDFHNGWMHDYDYNFTPKQFNGSKRTSIPESEVSAEALQLGKDYTTIIYPAIRRSYLKDGKLPTAIDSIPELRTYYSTHPKWGGIATSRLDGTMISRPLYVDNPPDAPHDPWTQHAFYLPGKRHPLYVFGWDDGRVTFNSMGDFYQSYSHTSYGTMELSAPPGAAGIPPSAVQNNIRFGSMR